MAFSVRAALRGPAEELYGPQAEGVLAYLPGGPLDAAAVRVVMINEGVAAHPEDDFYGAAEQPEFLETTLPLFRKAGRAVENIVDITKLGVYLTSALKLPKRDTAVSRAEIEAHLPLLEAELALFPGVQAIMLNGDVARKAFNALAKKSTGKNALPGTSTYKLRHEEMYYKGIRLFPAYIMTGGNILIEKSKVEMSAQDLHRMLAYVEGEKE